MTHNCDTLPCVEDDGFEIIPWKGDEGVVRWKRVASIEWQNVQDIHEFDYECGYCGNKVGSNKGWYAIRKGDAYHITSTRLAWAIICPVCKGVSYAPKISEFRHIILPRPKHGETIAGLPPKVEAIYEEARSSMQAGAFTGAVQLCRTLLNHIAVEKKADPGKTFAAYIDYLDAHGYIPPDGKSWVTHIKDMGNEANHELRVFTPEEATEVVDFTALLLRFAYPKTPKTKKTP